MGEVDSLNLTCKIKRLITVWAVFITSVKAEIHCYCNQPSCVSTSYMCRSVSGSCFTELFTYSTDLSKARHGCIESLPLVKRMQCRPPTITVDSLPVAICCREDMCNYRTTLDVNIKVLGNTSQVTGSIDYTKKQQAYEAALQQDVWFKAAVIAVPFAGGFILILLILLATRMLRQDSKRQRQLLELRQQQQRLCSNTKPQFLIQHPCVSHQNCAKPQNCPKANHAYGNACVPCDNWYADAIPSNHRQYIYDNSPDRTSCDAMLLPKPHQQKPPN